MSDRKKKAPKKPLSPADVTDLRRKNYGIEPEPVRDITPQVSALVRWGFGR